MIIAIDFDDTYTADHELWELFIHQATSIGHDVYCVTCRVDDSHNRECVRIPGIPKARHIFTDMAAKRWHMDRLGIRVDVWIDDMPETILHGR